MSEKKNAIDILLLIARPAAGKSEIIDYLKRVDDETRLKRFHIRKFEEFDDFPMLWSWFEEDSLLYQMGHPRLHTDKNGYFRETYLWDLLIRRLCLEYDKKHQEIYNYHQQHTALIEFSRGKEHGGYRRAFENLSESVIQKMAILYINVSWQESLRKNRRRFNPDRPGSILEHGLPDEKMEKLYRDTDWDEISQVNPSYIEIGKYHVPYVVFENEDDVTTERGEALGQRLEECMAKLWDIYRSPAHSV